MPIFEKRTLLAASPERVFAFHEAPDALERLTPPWDRVRVLEKTGGLAVGARVVLELQVGPVRQRWVAVHTAFDPPRLFRDEQESGPFARWVHTHRVEPAPGGAWLVDHVEYTLPLGLIGAIGGGWFVRRKLERMFAYRHEVTRQACETP